MRLPPHGIASPGNPIAPGAGRRFRARTLPAPRRLSRPVTLSENFIAGNEHPRGTPSGFWLAVLLGAAILLTPVGAPAAAEPAPLQLNEEQAWGYAEFLFRKREYFRAISEYRRLLHFFPAGERGEAARLRIGEALLRGGESRQAIGHLDALLAESAGSRRAGGRGADERPADTARYLRALSWLEVERGRPYPLRLEFIEAALKDLEAISPDWPGRERVEGFLKAQREPPDLPEKSPLLAGTLSAFLPGAGSFYVGRFAEGSLAFFVTGLLGYASVEAFDEDKPGVGTLMGAFALAFYGGSILAAVNGAHKFNDSGRATYLEEQRNRFGIVVAPGGIAGAFRRKF